MRRRLHPLIPLPAWRRAARRARRSVALRWLAVAAAAALVAVEAAQVGADATARRDAWGSTVPVAVAVADLEIGDEIRPGDVAVEQQPSAVVPEGALDDAVGRVVTAAIVAGEVVVEARVAPSGLDGVVALVPPGWRALAVPSSPGPPLAVGDRVEVLAPDVVAADAIVVDVAEDVVTVAVPADDAPAVADAVAVAYVVLALKSA